MKNQKMVFVVIAVIIAGAAFYGGMTYGKGKSTALPNFANMTAEQREQMRASGGLGAGRPGAGGAVGNTGGGFVNGEIISKDDKSVTVKLREGGSKIIFFSDATKISKATDGALSDLEAGKQVMIIGKANADGSVTAETINLNANLMPRLDGNMPTTPEEANPIK
jgi:hypothetical protein